MIKLNTKGYVWLDLGEGQKVKCKTPNYIDLKQAGQHEDVREAGTGEDGNPLPEATLLMARHLVQDTLLGWAGILDEEGNPADYSEAAAAAFADDLEASAQYFTAYIDHLNVVDAEKNASAPSLNGNSAGEANIAAPAETPAATAPE